MCTYILQVHYAHFTIMRAYMKYILVLTLLLLLLLFVETIWLKPIHDKNDGDDDEVEDDQ